MSKKPFEYNLEDREERKGIIRQSADDYDLDDRRTCNSDKHTADFDSYTLDDDLHGEDDEKELEHEEEHEEGEEGEEEKDDNSAGSRHPGPVTLLLYMMTNPVEGWKRIRRADISPEDTAAKCFYPLTALASLSVFAELLYGTLTGFTSALIKALLVFISFFFGYFLVKIMTKIFTPQACRKAIDSNFGKEYVMYLLSTLTIFYTAGSLLPMLDSLLVFLPLWTIYLATKGVRFFKFSDSRTALVTVLLCCYIILAPVAIYSLFADILLP